MLHFFCRENATNVEKLGRRETSKIKMPKISKISKMQKYDQL